jgi:hypothetical protein
MGLSRGNVCASASPKQVRATNEYTIFIQVTVFIEIPSLRFLEIAIESNRILIDGDYFVNSPTAKKKLPAEHEVPRTVLLACKGWEVERQPAA